MKLFKKTVIASAVAFVTNAAYAVDVTYSISPDNKTHEISPLIYGTNQNMYMSGNENFGFFRIGGNRLTGYNWENNWSNAGADWKHSSDSYMIPNGADGSTPGITLTHFIENDVTPSAKAMVTLQMAGYVSADGDGSVSETEVAPSARWVPAYARKNAPFSLTPDLNDNAVYMDELVNFLVDRYGRAEDGGVLAYSLDNEPGLWYHTHPYIHPEGTGAMELIDRSVEMASAVKDVDSSAEIFGPSLFGFGAYLTLADAPDWASYSDQYNWYIDFYLDHMQSASANEGKRLLDVLDLHWYSEATGDSRVTDSGATSRTDQITRLQAPRSLWDSDYVENSWIGEWFSADLPLIPHVQESIDTFYPDTKLAFTEYSFGGANQISGGVAQADVLGIYGKYNVYAATAWLLESDSSYIAAAFRLFRNYDGANSGFGDISVNASMSDKETSSVYASIDSDTGDLHVVVINKDLDEAITGVFNIDSTTSYKSGEIFAMTQNSTEIQELGALTVNGNSFSYDVPPVSAYHLVISADSAVVSSSSSSLSSITLSSSSSSSANSVPSSSSVSSSSSAISSSSSSSTSSASSSVGVCNAQCDWYGTLHALCTDQSSGWGWENQLSCIGEATCNSQWGNGGVVDDCGSANSSVTSVSSISSVTSVSSVSSDASVSVSSSSASSISDASVSATVEVSNDWGTGYCAVLVLENTGGSVAEIDISVNVEGTIGSLWGGSWSQSGSVLKLQGLAWNSTLEPAEIDNSIGFCANR